MTPGSVMTGDKDKGYVPLEAEQKYAVAALDFAAHGNEGYGAFTEGKVLMDEEV